MVIHEDNTSAITAIKKGYSPSLRHMPRTQRVCLGSLHEVLYDDEQGRTAGGIQLVHSDTKTHKGDIFTKEMPPKDFNSKLSFLRVSNSCRKHSRP